MVQIIRRTPYKSTSDYFAEALGTFGQSQGQASAAAKLKGAQEQENKAIKDTYGIDLTGITDPKSRQAIMTEQLKGHRKQEEIQNLRNLRGENQASNQKPEEQNQPWYMKEVAEPDVKRMPAEQSLTSEEMQALKIPDEAIEEAAIINPSVAREWRAAKDAALKRQQKTIEFGQKQRENERSYHTGYSKEQEKEVETLRSSLPKKKTALNFARNAVETGDFSYFSPDKLADATGVDLFRTAKGAQLVTAGKENLLSNLSRVSARAQNLWMEQRMASMFPKIGQSKEANLTTQEMLEGEVALDNAYLNEFDRVVEEDEKNYGFTKKDAAKRARNNIKPLEKEIASRTAYRMKEIEEQEQGLSKMKPLVGKNVPKGTPLTLAMAKLYKEKFGKEALQVAEKNGYHVPSVEQFKIYQSPISQFDEAEE